MYYIIRIIRPSLRISGLIALMFCLLSIKGCTQRSVAIQIENPDKSPSVATTVSAFVTASPSEMEEPIVSETLETPTISSKEKADLSEEQSLSLADFVVTHLARNPQTKAMVHLIVWVEGELAADVPLTTGKLSSKHAWKYADGLVVSVPIRTVPPSFSEISSAFPLADVIVLFGISSWDPALGQATVRLDRWAGPKAGSGYQYLLEWKPNSPIPWVKISEQPMWIN